MEQSSTSRAKLIPKKFGSVSNKHHSMPDNNDNFAQNRGLKRKNEDDISVGGKRSFTATPTGGNSPGKKFSANARLSQYRKALESKQNEVVKVHTLQKAGEDVHVQKVQGGCHAVSSSVNQRLKVSVKEDCKRNAHTVSAKVDCSRKFEAVANTVNQRLNVSVKEDCRRKVPESPTKEDYNHKFDTFAEAVNRHFNVAIKDDCRRKAQTFPPVQASPVKEDCSRKFEAVSPVPSNRRDSFVKEDFAQNLNINTRLNKYKDSALEEKQNSSSFDNEETDMDWSPINEEQLIADINNIRQNTSEILNHKSSFQATISDEIPRNDFIFKDTFIVVDTNIFISHLNVVRYLLDVRQNVVDRPFVLIPWVVIQELDYMKAGRDARKVLQISARKAIDFINENLLLKNTTMKGQSVIDATKHSIPCNNLDDGILACCLQVIERGNRAILLSNDKNLRNKSLVNAVPAYSSEEIFRQLGVASPTKRISSKQNLPKSNEVKRQLTTLFNTIIHSEALSAYGEVYHKMGVFKDAPWNLEQCLQKFEKLWIAVFSEKLPKQCLQNIEEFKKFLSSRKWINTEADHERLIKFGLNVSLFLKNGLNEYYQLIAESIDRIVKLT